jgi:hypothetical protein
MPYIVPFHVYFPVRIYKLKVVPALNVPCHEGVSVMGGKAPHINLGPRWSFTLLWRKSPPVSI